MTCCKIPENLDVRRHIYAEGWKKNNGNTYFLFDLYNIYYMTILNINNAISKLKMAKYIFAGYLTYLYQRNYSKLNFIIWRVLPLFWKIKKIMLCEIVKHA